MAGLHPTKIQWATHSVNPIYAVQCESLVEWRLDEDALQSVLRRKKPAHIFWCDMTDLFHERVPDDWIDRIFATMALTPQHKHLVLTKRPERMEKYFTSRDAAGVIAISIRKVAPDGGLAAMRAMGTHVLRDVVQRRWPLPNVAIGTSVSTQGDADENTPHLLNTPAALRFVSYEPAIENVLWDDGEESWLTCDANEDWEEACASRQLGMGHFQGIDLVIIGGESGKGAAPFDLAWARSTIAQCEAAGVVAMVKQVGANVLVHRDECCAPTWSESGRIAVVGGIGSAVFEWQPKHSHGGDPSEWPEDLRPYAASVERWPW